MLVHGTNKVSLFNLQSDIELGIRTLLAEEYKDFKAGNLPDWFSNFDRVKRKELSFAATDASVPAVPDPEDFYAFPFRHISETVVGAGTFKATDFSHKRGLLSKAKSLLENKPAYINHMLVAGEEIGFVGETTYRKPYRNSNGQEIPGGIEGPFVIDSVLHGDLVRKMNSPVSPINSASVTVIFNWVASHEFEDERDFFWHLGEVIDDEMVRRNVEEIVQFEESSLVWAGADPYAKMLDDNNEVIDIDQAGVFSKNKFSKKSELTERDWAKKYYVFDCLEQSKVLHLNKAESQETDTNTNKTMNKELIAKLAKFFGVSAVDIEGGKFTAEDVDKFEPVSTEEYQKVKGKADSYDKEQPSFEKASKDLEESKKITEAFDKALPVLQKSTGEQEFDKCVESVQALAKFKEENEEFAKQGKQSLEALREQVKKTYSAFAKGNPDEAILKDLESINNVEKLESYVKTFGGELASSFSATCGECGSKDVRFQSSRGSTPTGNEGDEVTPHLTEQFMD